MKINKILFICVNYNNANYTLDFCNSLKSQIGVNVDFYIDCIIIDNSSSNRDSKIIEDYIKDFPWISYIRAPENLGYFGGLNYGLKLVDKSDSSYIAICNNDLIFESDFCNKIAINKYNRNVFAVCPDIITADGIHQNPHNLSQIGFLRRFQFDLHFSHYYCARIISLVLGLIRPVKSSPQQPPTACEIHMGVGACYVLTSAFFKKFRELDYPHFLYAEEAYLTNQIHSVGGVLWFDPDLRVHHAESASLSKIPKRTAYEFGKTSYWGCRQFLLNKKNNAQ